jgi:type VI secretion system protein VasJ
LESGAGGWLDLQRYTFKAGKELGLDRVAEVVKQATAVLVSRIGGLLQMRLSDGTPAADPETLTWLKSLSPADAAVDSGAAPDGDLDALARRIPEQRCARDRFLRRLDLARLSLNSGQNAIAKALLADLSQEIEHRNLEDWEAPEVVAAVLELLLRATADDDELAQQRGALYARLCRIAPARALALQNRN